MARFGFTLVMYSVRIFYPYLHGVGPAVSYCYNEHIVIIQLVSTGRQTAVVQQLGALRLRS